MTKSLNQNKIDILMDVHAQMENIAGEIMFLKNNLKDNEIFKQCDCYDSIIDALENAFSEIYSVRYDAEDEADELSKFED